MSRKVLLAALAVLLIGSQAFAATRTWDGDTDANWFTAGNWRTTAAVPTTADTVVIGSKDYVEVYSPVFSASSPGYAPSTITKMYVGYSEAGQLLVDSGSLTLSGEINVGFGSASSAVSGSGTLVQTGGDVRTSSLRLAHFAGTTGAYDMSGGTLTTTADLQLGNTNTATFNMTGGAITVGTLARWGYKGTAPVGYLSATMSGGSIESVSASFHWVDLTFTGGTIAVTGTPTETYIPVKWEPTAHVYFDGGTMLLKSDRTLDVAQWIADGKMLTHKEFGWHVASTYNAETGYTTISSVVPEPSSVLALITGLVGVVGIATRRRR